MTEHYGLQMAARAVGRKQALELATQDRAEFWHEAKRIAGKRKSLPEPAGAWISPGSALVLEPWQRKEQHAIAAAHGELVICDEIDLCDLSFYDSALPILKNRAVDMVIGSKAAKGASDRRPWVRRVATRVHNKLLKLTLGFKGTDTHGIKAFRRERLLPAIRACVVDKDVFASEFVIRAYRQGLDVLEIPIQLREKRQPSVHLLRRIPNVLKNVAKLVYVIRVRGA